MKREQLRIDNMNVHYFHHSLDTFLDEQKKTGMNHLVFWAGVPHLWVDHYGAEPHRDIFEKISSAGLMIDALAARPYNYTLFAEPGSLLGTHSMTYYKVMIDLAHEQTVSLLSIELWGALRDLDRERQRINCRNALSELCRYAESKKVTLAVANVCYSHSSMMNTLSDIKSLIEEIKSDHLTAAMDYGAAWRKGESMDEWTDAFGERLSMIYLSGTDNHGDGYALSHGCCATRKELERLAKREFSGIIALRMSHDSCLKDPAGIDRQNIRYLMSERG